MSNESLPSTLKNKAPQRVLICGTFDYLHPGHCFLIREAQKYGTLSVIVAQDGTVERVKGRKPLQNEQKRMKVLRETFPELHVLLGDKENFLTPVLALQPDLLFLGYDQQLPPGIREQDLPCALARLPPFHPEKYKSSLRRCGRTPSSPGPSSGG